MRKTTLTPVLIFLSFSGIFSAAKAQKLPNVQTTIVRAPANIKIDGKATEWHDEFQAHNHATDIFYTVSNDDTKLYLTVQAKDAQVINKIIDGGITFTIQQSGKKTDKGGIAVTYPLFYRRKRPYIRSTRRGVESGPHMVSDAVMGGKVDEPKLLEGDSIMRVYNKQLSDNSKYIAVTGVKAIEDPLISIYNADGVKAEERVDNKITYTYELAIDLKLLGLDIKQGPATFMYHIAINGSSLFALPDGGNNGGHEKMGTAVADGNEGGSNMPIGVMGMEATTDLWGQYTLAKQ